MEIYIKSRQLVLGRLKFYASDLLLFSQRLGYSAVSLLLRIIFTESLNFLNALPFLLVTVSFWKLDIRTDLKRVIRP